MNPDPHKPHSHRSPRGNNRGYLPHCDAGNELAQSVTFRIGDSVPSRVIAAWQVELKDRPERERLLELHRLIEAFLDTGWGACHLRDPRIAEMVERALLFFDTSRYALHAWVVMPNHVHVLFTPQAGCSMSAIVGSWKSFTSRRRTRSSVARGNSGKRTTLTGTSATIRISTML